MLFPKIASKEISLFHFFLCTQSENKLELIDTTVKEE